MPDVVDRRTFVRIWLAVGAGSLGVAIGCGEDTTAPRRAVLRLADWVAESEDARILGRAYLTAHPEEADREILVDLVARGLRLPIGLGDADARLLARDRIRGDFDDAATLTLEGWILSRTEVRLCGLAVLAGLEAS